MRENITQRYETDHERGPYGCTMVLLCVTEINGSGCGGGNDYELKRDTNNKD
jgi:hypothetical protein